MHILFAGISSRHVRTGGKKDSTSRLVQVVVVDMHGYARQACHIVPTHYIQLPFHCKTHYTQDPKTDSAQANYCSLKTGMTFF